MKLEFHHVAILCDDIEESLSFYRDLLSLQLVTRLYQEGQFDVAVLSDRSPQPTFLLALHGRPFSGWRRDDYESGGAQMHALGFIANDIDAWSDRLCSTPLKLERLTHPFPSSDALSVRDPSGVNVDLLGFHAEFPCQHGRNGHPPRVLALGALDHETKLQIESY